jgi:hypothetical protein
MFLFSLPVVSMVATLEGDQAPVGCYSLSLVLLFKKALLLPVSPAGSSSGTRRGGGP